MRHINKQDYTTAMAVNQKLNSDRILIIDFGSQVTQLIARRVRESGVYCEVWPFNKIKPERLEKFHPNGIILSGGPASTTEDFSPRAPDFIFDLKLPILGICYGQQTICTQLGGQVENHHHREFGRSSLKIIEECRLFDGIWPKNSQHQVWMSHGDRVTQLPEGFKAVAITDGAPFAAIANENKKIYAVQFHPEVAHTPDGAKLIKNFTHHIAECAGQWNMAEFKEQAIQKIQDQVGDQHVICGLSGGVDSSVTAALIHEAIGDQLTCIFVDTGLMRRNEAEQVTSLFRDHYNIPLIAVDAKTDFLSKLLGVTDPEKKRKIIGKTFIDIFDKTTHEIPHDVSFLAQGTLYPDVIESVSFTGGASVTIKSHHNVGGLPETMALSLVEPLRELFKDEVRDLGRELGLHDDFIKRHPFPGPGLAVRMPGVITEEKIATLQHADLIFIEELHAENLYDVIWQAFAVLLPVKTVGVMGDSRSYAHACALRAVTSTDGMTADFYPISHEILGKIATRIINEVEGINRVVYDITSKPPGTIEWE